MSYRLKLKIVQRNLLIISSFLTGGISRQARDKYFDTHLEFTFIIIKREHDLSHILYYGKENGGILCHNRRHETELFAIDGKRPCVSVLCTCIGLYKNSHHFDKDLSCRFLI